MKQLPPSIFFDAVVILANEEQASHLSTQAGAVDWVRDAFGHLKVIAHTPGAQALLARAGIEEDEAVVSLGDNKSVAAFIKAAKQGRLWKREPALRSPG